MHTCKLLLVFSFSFALQAKILNDFTLPIYNSPKSFVLSKEVKKYDKILLNFWASWCTGCIEELPDLEQLKKSSSNVLFVGVNAGEKKKKIKKFIKKHGFSFLIVEDKDRIISKSLGVLNLPRTFVLDKNRNILFEGDRPPKGI